MRWLPILSTPNRMGDEPVSVGVDGRHSKRRNSDAQVIAAA